MIENPTKKSQEAMEAKTLAVPPRERSGEGGSTVVVDPILESGVKIAEITVDDEEFDLYAPAGGGGGSLPSGGTAGQVLTKTGDQDDDYDWRNPTAPSLSGITCRVKSNTEMILQHYLTVSDITVTNISDDADNINMTPLFAFQLTDIPVNDIENAVSFDARMDIMSGKITLTCPSTVVDGMVRMNFAFSPASVEIEDDEMGTLAYLSVDHYSESKDIYFDNDTHQAEINLNEFITDSDFEVKLYNLSGTAIPSTAYVNADIALNLTIENKTNIQGTDTITATLDPDTAFYLDIPAYKEVVLPYHQS